MHPDTSSDAPAAADKRAVVVTLTPKEGGTYAQSFKLRPGGEERIRIGRAPDNEVVVDVKGSSNFHAELRLVGTPAEDPKLLIADKSTNGTAVKVEDIVTRIKKGVDTDVPDGAMIMLPVKIKGGNDGAAVARASLLVSIIETVPKAKEDGENDVSTFAQNVSTMSSGAKRSAAEMDTAEETDAIDAVLVIARSLFVLRSKPLELQRASRELADALRDAEMIGVKEARLKEVIMGAEAAKASATEWSADAARKDVDGAAEQAGSGGVTSLAFLQQLHAADPDVQRKIQDLLKQKSTSGSSGTIEASGKDEWQQDSGWYKSSDSSWHKKDNSSWKQEIEMPDAMRKEKGRTDAHDSDRGKKDRSKSRRSRSRRRRSRDRRRDRSRSGDRRRERSRSRYKETRRHI